MGSLSFPGKSADPGWKSHTVTISLANISTAIAGADQGLTTKHENMQVDKPRVELVMRNMTVVNNGSDMAPIEKPR